MLGARPAALPGLVGARELAGSHLDRERSLGERVSMMELPLYSTDLEGFSEIYRIV